MGYSRRFVGSGILALSVPFAGCSQLTAHETAGQVEVTILDADAENVEDAPPYDGSPVSEVDVVDETVEKARAEYEPGSGQATATTEVNDRELRRASEAVSDSNPGDGNELGSYFADDAVYIVVWLKNYS